MRRLARLWRDQAGSSALEFALVVPVLVALTLGAVNLCFLLYAQATLHYAVDDTARCMSVKTFPVTGCTLTACSCETVAKAQAYAALRYKGPAISGLTFTPAFLQQCPSGSGSALYSKVTGAATYQLNAIVTNISVPMSATSCFHS